MSGPISSELTRWNAESPFTFFRSALKPAETFASEIVVIDILRSVPLSPALASALSICALPRCEIRISVPLPESMSRASSRTSSSRHRTFEKENFPAHASRFSTRLSAKLTMCLSVLNFSVVEADFSVVEPVETTGFSDFRAEMEISSDGATATCGSPSAFGSTSDFTNSRQIWPNFFENPRAFFEKIQ